MERFVLMLEGYVRLELQMALRNEDAHGDKRRILKQLN